MAKKSKASKITVGNTTINVAAHKGITKETFKKMYSGKFPNWEEMYEAVKAARK